MRLPSLFRHVKAMRLDRRPGGQMIKPFVGTLSLLAIMSAPAMAADMRARPLPPPVLATTWTGCHIGGAVGTASGISPGYSSTAATTVGVFPGVTVIPAGTQVSGRMYMTGLTGGAYGGCDIQFGTWVVGVEGDWMANNKEGQAHATILVPGAGAGAIWSLKERWYATARGRLGYAVDKWLFYVTGGAAWMKLDSAEFVVSPTAAVLNPVSSAVLQSDSAHRLDRWRRRGIRAPLQLVDSLRISLYQNSELHDLHSGRGERPYCRNAEELEHRSEQPDLPSGPHVSVWRLGQGPRRNQIKPPSFQDVEPRGAAPGLSTSIQCRRLPSCQLMSG